MVEVAMGATLMKAAFCRRPVIDRQVAGFDSQGEHHCRV
jgi:hypothetical protein